MPNLPLPTPASSQNLTQLQKEQIFMHYEEQKASNPLYRQEHLSSWAKETFNLSYLPSKPPAIVF